ncbi:MAG: hypothetical protein ACRD0K_29830, partial [Egibacteraceae bacterium]
RLVEQGRLNGEAVSDRERVAIEGFCPACKEVLAAAAVIGVKFRRDLPRRVAEHCRHRGRPSGGQRAAERIRHALDDGPLPGTRLLPDRPTASPERAARHALLRREGEYWTVAYQGAACRLKHTIGLGYLARLLQAPGREFHAIDLAAGASRRAAQSGDAGHLLDPQAKAAYRRRLEDLAEELEEAERWNDPERAARARSEIDALTQQLVNGVGLGGRDRRAASDAERARSSVSKALKTAIRKIAACDAGLGDHLSRSVKTGTFCVYDPDPAVLILWRS